MAQKRQGDTHVSFEELAEIVSGKDSPGDIAILKELSNAISDFLMNESVRNIKMFVRRYWYYDSIEMIAEAFRMNPRTVCSLLCRMRKRLKKHVKKEGYGL